MSIENLSPTQLRQAADLKDKIAGLEKQLAGIIFVGGKTHAPVIALKAAKPVKRKMSAGHIAKIRAAQKLRWAKYNAAKTAPKTAAPKPVKKGGMSAEGKVRIAAAQKARWAKIKAAKTAAKPVVKAEVEIAPKPVTAPKPVKKFGMSAAAKAKISAAAKARWAKIKAKK